MLLIDVARVAPVDLAGYTEDAVGFMLEDLFGLVIELDVYSATFHQLPRFRQLVRPQDRAALLASGPLTAARSVDG